MTAIGHRGERVVESESVDDSGTAYKTIRVEARIGGESDQTALVTNAFDDYWDVRQQVTRLGKGEDRRDGKKWVILQQPEIRYEGNVYVITAKLKKVWAADA